MSKSSRSNGSLAGFFWPALGFSSTGLSRSIMLSMLNGLSSTGAAGLAAAGFFPPAAGFAGGGAGWSSLGKTSRTSRSRSRLANGSLPPSPPLPPPRPRSDSENSAANGSLLSFPAGAFARIGGRGVSSSSDASDPAGFIGGKGVSSSPAKGSGSAIGAAGFAAGLGRAAGAAGAFGFIGGNRSANSSSAGSGFAAAGFIGGKRSANSSSDGSGAAAGAAGFLGGSRSATSSEAYSGAAESGAAKSSSEDRLISGTFSPVDVPEPSEDRLKSSDSFCSEEDVLSDWLKLSINEPKRSSVRTSDFLKSGLGSACAVGFAAGVPGFVGVSTSRLRSSKFMSSAGAGLLTGGATGRAAGAGAAGLCGAAAGAGACGFATGTGAGFTAGATGATGAAGFKAGAGGAAGAGGFAGNTGAALPGLTGAGGATGLSTGFVAGAIGAVDVKSGFVVGMVGAAGTTAGFAGVMGLVVAGVGAIGLIGADGVNGVACVGEDVGMPPTVGATGSFLLGRLLPVVGVNPGLFLIIGLTGNADRRGRAELFADATSGFPQQGQNLMTMSHSSQ